MQNLVRQKFGDRMFQCLFESLINVLKRFLLLKAFFYKIVDWVSQYRWWWGCANLRRSNVEEFKERKDLNSNSASNQGLFLMKNRLREGWYMVEMRVALSAAKANVRFQARKDQYENNLDWMDLTLRSGHLCKRVLRIGSGGATLAILLETAERDVEVQEFRLVRVFEGFATSRMLTKLQALHPSYKLTLNRYRTTGVKGQKEVSNLLSLWADYCDLFSESSDLLPYSMWFDNFDVLANELVVEMVSRAGQFINKPLMSIVMPVYNTHTAWLVKSIESVREQIYTNWELCIADDASTDTEVRLILEQYAKKDPRIKVTFRECNGHISAASNSALLLARGEWIVLLDHDDVLPKHALFWVVDAINRNPECKLFYSDEDKIDENGVRSSAYFKPDWNEDLFYSQNLFSHLGVYHASLVREVGGFRTGLEGSQDYDLALRCIERIGPKQICHIPKILYHWRIHPESTALYADVKPYAMVAGENAINEHFLRCGIEASAKAVGYGYRVRYALPESLPLVSLIIPTRNGLKLLRKCVESILEKTSYKRYELLIVDNGSDDAAALKYLKKISSDQRVRVVRDDRPFNYSALNNSAVKLANGEVIGLINNDIEVINPDWLCEMVSHAMRPEVGAVGARLWYSDDTIQHAGVVLGIHGIAGHVHRFLPRDNVGYCGRASLIQSFSAVTGACLVVRKSLYEAVGGLNEVELQVAGNDVDFCLRLREAGYRNIWTPYAELYHHESATRGFDDTPEKQARSAKEVAYMKARWGDALLHDPAYNPNLSLDTEDFSLAWPPRVASLGADHASL